jgi:parallel beta-helix repeat protein
MKLKKTLQIVILVLLLTALLPTSICFKVQSEANLPVLNIDTGMAYPTIQQAMDADSTLNGHTIRVDPGTYYENVVMNKAVSLLGENKFSTVIDGGLLGSVVYITADNVRIAGFTIRNSRYGYGGIYGYQCYGINISGNVVKDNYNGVYLYGSSDSVVCDNDVLGNEYGIHLYGSINVSISRNVAPEIMLLPTTMFLQIVGTEYTYTVLTTTP